MNVRQTAALKWIFYALAALLLCFLRRLLLGSALFWGVLPFLPPVLLATEASLEQPKPAVLSGIVFGALCDLVLPSAFPCLYTLAFTLASLLTATVMSSLLQKGLARAFFSSVLTFAIMDLFKILFLLPRGASAPAMLYLFLRETIISCVLLLPCYPLLRTVHRLFAD